VTIRIRVLILLLSALVCVAIVITGGLVYRHYTIHYGTHGWGPPEVAFLLHYRSSAPPPPSCSPRPSMPRSGGAW
jgi:hypothetical protein